MVDTNDIIREWLISTGAVTSLLGTNANGSIYATPDLPEHFDTKLGPGIQVFGAGGTPHGEITPLVNDRKCLKVWAAVGKNKLAKMVFGACFDLMHGANGVDFGSNGRVITCQFETMPQEVTDPDSGDITVIAFLNIEAIQTAPVVISDYVDHSQTVKEYVDEVIFTDITAVDGGTT